MTNKLKVPMVVEAIAEIAPMHRTKRVTREDIKAWVKAHYRVQIDDRWLAIFLREHVIAFRRHDERKNAQKDANLNELANLMIDEIVEAMQRHEIESN